MIYTPINIIGQVDIVPQLDHLPSPRYINVTVSHQNHSKYKMHTRGTCVMELKANISRPLLSRGKNINLYKSPFLLHIHPGTNMLNKSCMVLVTMINWSVSSYEEHANLASQKRSCHCITNYRQLDKCVRLSARKTSKLCVTGTLCMETIRERIITRTKASEADKFSMPSHHHEIVYYLLFVDKI